MVGELHSFNKHLLSISCVPGTEFTEATDKSLPLWGFYVGGRVPDQGLGHRTVPERKRSKESESLAGLPK